jgi:phosphohistidine swiveling domain-containing protein
MDEKFKTPSKVNTLNLIKKNLTFINIPKYIFFTKKDFEKNKKYYLKKINLNFKTNIIIRSSSLDEDTHKTSNAGKFDSIIIKKGNFNTLEKSIFKIIKKFKNKDDQILVQSFISKPDISGVVFTKDINTNSDYYQIEYDVSKRSDLVTSGKKNPSLKTLIVFKKSNQIPIHFKKLINISRYLENLFNNNRLDIEFCIKKNRVFIFQCRPLLGVTKISDIRKHEKILVNLKKKFDKINLTIPNISGKNTILSNMADWNPAEMIGAKPGKLSISLYSELITNSIWSLQRSTYGYKDVKPNRLMIDMAGAPYIDLRIDLNSFLPKKLNNSISSKLVENAINTLKKNPAFHDKIEFKIIDTCYNFILEKKKFNFLENKEKKKYIENLKELTNDILNPKNKILEKEIKYITKLTKKINVIKNTNLSPIQKIFYHIHDCKKYGTLPFAGIARCAFVSKSIMDSLLNEKLLQAEDMKNFNMSIRTVSKKINNDYMRCLKTKNFKSFVLNYGHVRPSMYSILNKNYKDNHKNYFSQNINVYRKMKTPRFNLSKNKKIEINKFFKKKGIIISFEEFIVFAKKSIENRELSKLIFSKSIDEIFINLKKLAKEINIDIKTFEHLDIDLIKKSFNNLNQEKLKDIIISDIKKNKEYYRYSKNIKLPDVITSSSNFDFFNELSSEENYITEKDILCKLVFLDKINNFEKLRNKIVLIESADPGYDFIFSYNIKGLITKYGGQNSHMAIRCNELNLPSIIGVGKKIYSSFDNVNKIYIDCKNKKFETFF